MRMCPNAGTDTCTESNRERNTSDRFGCAICIAAGKERAGLDVSESAESVDFQLEDKLIGIERLSTAGKPYGTHLRGNIHC